MIGEGFSFLAHLVGKRSMWGNGKNFTLLRCVVVSFMKMRLEGRLLLWDLKGLATRVSCKTLHMLLGRVLKGTENPQIRI